MIKLIKKLSEAHGISGHEDEVRSILKAELKDSYEIEVDVMGNLIAKKGEGKKKVMIAAHMDEIGLMVQHIDDNGFIRFAKVGGIDNFILPNKTIEIYGENVVKGIIGYDPEKFTGKDKEKNFRNEDMFIDVGCNTKKEVDELGIEIGSPITFSIPFSKNKQFIFGKAFDNRLGCFVLTELAKLLSDVDFEIYLVGTTQEEVGLRGARTVSYNIAPDYCLIVDTIPANDLPVVKEPLIKLKGGPVLRLVDGSREGLKRGYVMHPIIKKIATEILINMDIPFQKMIREGGITDAASVRLSRSGIPTGSISIPIRYSHHPPEMANLNTINNTINLIANLTTGLE